MHSLLNPVYIVLRSLWSQEDWWQKGETAENWCVWTEGMYFPSPCHLSPPLLLEGIWCQGCSNLPWEWARWVFSDRLCWSQPPPAEITTALTQNFDIVANRKDARLRANGRSGAWARRQLQGASPFARPREIDRQDWNQASLELVQPIRTKLELPRRWEGSSPWTYLGRSLTSGTSPSDEKSWDCYYLNQGTPKSFSG